jgi:hypothetical protein
MENRFKIGEILDFSTFLNIDAFKYTYVFLAFTLKLIIYQVF